MLVEDLHDVDKNLIYLNLSLMLKKYFKFVKKMISLSNQTNVISLLQQSNSLVL